MGPRTYDGCNFFGLVAFTYLHYGRTGAEKMVCNQRRTEAGASHFFGLCTFRGIVKRSLRDSLPNWSSPIILLLAGLGECKRKHSIASLPLIVTPPAGAAAASSEREGKLLPEQFQPPNECETRLLTASHAHHAKLSWGMRRFLQQGKSVIIYLFLL